jgi:hypothetical protein
MIRRRARLPRPGGGVEPEHPQLDLKGPERGAEVPAGKAPRGDLVEPAGSLLQDGFPFRGRLGGVVADPVLDGGLRPELGPAAKRDEGSVASREGGLRQGAPTGEVAAERLLAGRQRLGRIGHGGISLA